jgi:hypothetical protein
MKRSCAGDNSPIIKKKLRDSTEQEKEKEETTNINHTSTITVSSIPATTSNTKTNPTFDMSVLRYVHDLVHNLEQGDIDHCLSKSIDLTKFSETLSKADSELLNALDLNLKKIAQRQLQLETENLRSRIMIQQQHQLLTAQGHEEKVTNRQQTDNNHKFDQDDSGGGGGSSSSSSNSSGGDGDGGDKTNITPEDNLSSVHDTSLLEKLENSYRQMAKVDLPTQGGYFGKYS